MSHDHILSHKLTRHDQNVATPSYDHLYNEKEHNKTEFKDMGTADRNVWVVKINPYAFLFE